MTFTCLALLLKKLVWRGELNLKGDSPIEEYATAEAALLAVSQILARIREN